MVRLSGVLMALGALAIVAGITWQLGLVPGSRVSVPAPVALQRTATPVPLPTVEPTPEVDDEPARAPAPVALAPRADRPAAAAPLPPAPDHADRKQAAAVPIAPAVPALPVGGYAVRLSIPAIDLDTPVEQGGVVAGTDGTPEWQTLPFVAVHYGDLTALVGGPGNAVIAGHVVTLREGNVFRSLYRLDFGDEISVWDEREREHDFRVVDVKLVAPSDVSVMSPTPDSTLTLITCGGTFDPRTREFSERLIVTAKASGR